MMTMISDGISPDKLILQNTCAITHAWPRRRRIQPTQQHGGNSGRSSDITNMEGD